MERVNLVLSPQVQTLQRRERGVGISGKPVLSRAFRAVAEMLIWCPGAGSGASRRTSDQLRGAPVLPHTATSSWSGQGASTGSDSGCHCCPAKWGWHRGDPVLGGAAGLCWGSNEKNYPVRTKLWFPVSSKIFHRGPVFLPLKRVKKYTFPWTWNSRNWLLLQQLSARRKEVGGRSVRK